ncbi:MAG: NADH-quinone oxidoreductase subunit NuoB [Bacteroidota bacterium]
MLKIIKRSIQTGVVTNAYPEIIAEPPEGLRGKPEIDFARCTACEKCASACPTDAISIQMSNADGIESRVEKILTLNYGDCIFCGECEVACPDTIYLSKEFQLAARCKDDLVSRATYRQNTSGDFEFVELTSKPSSSQPSINDIGSKLQQKIQEIFGRSLHIREVDAGSCNGCEVEITALNNSIYDIERFGIHFVASPRHADMLLVTGPVTRNMEIALKQTFEATPGPKLVVAVGACAIGGGIFGASYASCGGVDNVIPVDVFIPGCPPRPEALLQGILLAIDKWQRNENKKGG